MLSLSDDIATAAGFAAIGAAVIGLYRWSRSLYARTLGSRWSLAVLLNELGSGVTVRYVEERFGAPMLARDFPAAGPGMAREGDDFRVRELVYRGRHAWLQVLVDDNDAVKRFSITVTDPKFKLSVRQLAPIFDVTLGRSSFSNLHPGREGHCGGRRFQVGGRIRGYSEAYWGGLDGNYQWFVLSYNEFGTGQFGGQALGSAGPLVDEGVLLPALGERLVGSPFDPGAPYARQFRSMTTINTLTVLGRTGRGRAVDVLGGTWLAEPFGPARGHVGFLGSRAKELRRWQRLARRLNQLARHLSDLTRRRRGVAPG